MPTEILMPALSPTMEEGTLAKWLVTEGDSVRAGDLLAEIETEKATLEFEAEDAGTVGKLLVAEGTDGVKVSTPIAILLEAGESLSDPCTRGSSAPEAAMRADARAEAAPGGSSETRAAPAASGGARIFASPLARRIATETGVDLRRITGSGPQGRIVRADLDGPAAGAAAATPASAPPAAASAMPTTGSSRPSADAGAAISEGRGNQEVALDAMRKTIAARVSDAARTVPQFDLRREVRLDALLACRAEINRQRAPRGVTLSLNDFIIKACALALQAVPEANAVWADDRILRLEPSDVAVAVALEGGLLTPVLRDADTRTLSALSAEMTDLAARARERSLAPEACQGGSLAISNLGMFGIESFDAILTPPQSAILAVGAGISKPVVDTQGGLTAATLMSVTLSVDHRVMDGTTGAALLRAIVDNLEHPLAMLA